RAPARFRGVGCQLHFAETGAAASVGVGHARRALRASGQAAARGRARGDWQGRLVARSCRWSAHCRGAARLAGDSAGLARTRRRAVPARGRRRQQGIPSRRCKRQMSTVLTISRLGAQGDGVADTPKGPVFVPFALPGERVNVAADDKKADLVAVLEASPLRIAPVCKHFGDCGGCAMQHLDPDAYRAWKRDKLVDALKAKGIDTLVDPLVSVEPQSRRRAALTARKTEAGVLLGFNAALTHRIVDMEECHVLLPSIVEKLDVLRALAMLVGRTPKPFRLGVTQTAS